MPVLSIQALRQRVATRDLAPIHLLLGDDARLTARVIEEFEATVDLADRPFAIDRLYAGEPGASAPDIVAAASTPSLLGGRRLVFLLRAEKLLKPKRAGKAADAADLESDVPGEAEDDGVDTTALEAYIESPSDCSSLIVVAVDVDRGRRLGKRLLARAQVTEFGPLSEGDPAARGGWIQEELARHDRSIEPAAMRLLVDRSGGEIGKLRGDVERLILFTDGRPKITAADVREVVSEEFAPDDWGVVNAIADGDAARALVQLGRRLDEGDSPHQLVGQLRWWVSTRLAEGDPARVRAALEALLRTDVALKGTGAAGDDRVLLERLVVELTGRPVPRTGWGGRR
jgi:DNA polymerase-3 subunit delta